MEVLINICLENGHSNTTCGLEDQTSHSNSQVQNFPIDNALTNKGTFKVCAILKVQIAQSFLIYAEEVSMQNSDNSFETPKGCLLC